ncbi:hypothetical protein LCGC14_0331660 [marine sediment metagenome]|uniref:Uncharacterized protein n=1 Tax=marine sediment metagenome TaxID=412755 RepID=A0A0F9TYZ3_9ZZZZ
MPNNSETTQKHENWPYLDEEGNVVRGEYWAPADPVPYYIDIRPVWLRIWHLFLVVVCGKDGEKLADPYMVPGSEAGSRKKRG